MYLKLAQSSGLLGFFAQNGSKQLLFGHVKLHGPFSKDTIPRRCKAILSTAGVDLSIEILRP